MRKYEKVISRDENYDVLISKDRMLAFPKLRIATMDFVQGFNGFAFGLPYQDEIPVNDALEVKYIQAYAVTWKNNRINFYQKHDGKWHDYSHLLVTQYAMQDKTFGPFLVFFNLFVPYLEQFSEYNGFTIPLSLLSSMPNIHDTRHVWSYALLLLLCPSVREFWKHGMLLDYISSDYPSFIALRRPNFKAAVRKSFGQDNKHLLRTIGTKMVHHRERARYIETRNLKGREPIQRIMKNKDLPLNTFRGRVKREVGEIPVFFEQIPDEFALNVYYFTMGFLVRGILDINRIHTLIEKYGNNYILDSLNDEGIKIIREFLILFPEPQRLDMLLDPKAVSSLLDTATMYTRYRDRIIMPIDWKNFKDLHDQIMVQFNQIMMEEQAKKDAEQDKVVFNIPENIRSLDGKNIDKNMTITIADNGKILREWGITMRNCIGSYFDRASEGKCYLIGVYKDGRITYNVEVTKDRKLAQFVGFANSSNVSVEDKDLVCNFLLFNGVLT